jgi:multiple sugar transport system permease protein
MLDGHNVFFDADATYGKSWGMASYMAWARKSLIIVAVECNKKGNGRLREYSPYNFEDPKLGKIRGRGKAYMEWLINDLKPMARACVTALFYIPTIVGAAGWGVWRLIFSSDQYGLINGFLMKLGLVNEPIGWLTDEAYILPVLIVVSLWMSMGISFLTFIAGFQNVDKTLYEAGMMDGIKNRFQELWYITIPSMSNQMIFGAVMQIVNCFAVGEVSAVLAGLPSTGYAGETIVTHIMDYGNLRFEFGYACAMGVVLVLMMQYSKKLATSLIGKMGH